jgi:hypothetical protein
MVESTGLNSVNMAKPSVSPRQRRNVLRRTSYQKGSLKLADRKKGKAWEYRWREVQIDGSVRRKNIVIGTLEEYPQRVKSPSRGGCAPLRNQPKNPSATAQEHHGGNAGEPLSPARTAGCLRQEESEAGCNRRGFQVVCDAGNLRGLSQEMDSSQVANVSVAGHQGCGSRKMAEDALLSQN